LNPDACSAIQQHGKSNLGILSIEMMSQYLHTVIMPQMIEKEEKEGNLNETEKITSSTQQIWTYSTMFGYYLQMDQIAWL
jgi:hypothetical protein